MTQVQHRLHTPTEEEIQECKRLFLILENARKTLRQDKTQTRRIIDPQPDEVVDGRALEFVSHEFVDTENNELVERTHSENGNRFCREIEPEYEAGETRLVTTPHWRSNEGCTKIWDGATRMVRFEGGREIPDCEIPFDTDDWHQIHASFLMPRWGSRIAVKVKDVWVERLQDISVEDALAEGVGVYYEMRDGVSGDYLVNGQWCGTAIDAFAARWDLLHGDGAWRRNDWVECVEYELLTG